MKTGKKAKKKIYDYDIPGYISYPPDVIDIGSQPALVLTQVDLSNRDKEKSIALMVRETEFRKTKNPIIAIEAFLLAHQLRIYPPLWAIDFFATAFKKYHDKMGLIDLETVLDLKGVGKRGGAFKPLLDDERDEMLMNDVYFLTRCGYSPGQASYIVSRFLESIADSEFNKTWIEIKKIKDTTIQDKYNRKWRKIFKDLDSIPDIKKHHDDWLRNNREQFLQKFRNVLTEEELRIPHRRKR